MTIDKGYQEALQNRHEDVNTWGKGKPKYCGGDLLAIIQSRGYIETILDYGCGKGHLGEYLREHFPNIQYTGYDPGVREFSKLPEGRFDLVTSSDVLEHIEPHNLDATLLEMWERTGKVMYNNIACTPTSNLFTEGPYTGQDLHLIIESPEWWLERFDKVFAGEAKYSTYEWRHVRRRWHGELRSRAVIIAERLG